VPMTGPGTEDHGGETESSPLRTEGLK